MNNKILFRQLLLLVLSSVSLILLVVNYYQSFMIDFVEGLFMSFGLTTFVFFLFLSLSKKQRKNLTLQTTDERIKMINEKSNSISTTIQQIILILFIIGFAFFQETVKLSILLTGILLINSLIFVITKIVLNKKY